MPTLLNARELLVRARNLITLRQQEKALKRVNERLEEQVQQQLAIILSERRTGPHPPRRKSD